MSRLITGIHHVALKAQGVEDYNRAVAFYRDVLGLPVVRIWANEVMHGAMLDTGAGQAKDPQQALRWLRASAAGRHPPAVEALKAR